MNKLRNGEDRCPRHSQALIKWEVRGTILETQIKKAVKLTLSKVGYGKIECKALSEDGYCLIDWGICLVDEIIEYLVKKRGGDVKLNCYCCGKEFESDLNLDKKVKGILGFPDVFGTYAISASEKNLIIRETKLSLLG